MRALLVLTFAVCVSANTLGNLVKRQEYDVNHDECGAEEEERQQCGRETRDEMECYSRGCCYERCEDEDCDDGAPRCFLAARMMRQECQVNYREKDDCGYYGIREGECMMRGCCWAPSNITNDPPCFRKAKDAVRLVGGTEESNGRVEIQHDGEWGTVCDDDFDNDDAGVVCRGLGYQNGRAYGGAHYGEGEGTIWLDGLRCRGNEDHITDCRHNGWGVHDCGHGEDASVACWNDGDEPPVDVYPSTPRYHSTPGYQHEPSDDPVRLVGGPSNRTGRVEILHNDEWGTVCDDEFDYNEAHVICRNMGYDLGHAIPSAYYRPGEGQIWMDDVHCTGQEESLGLCRHLGWGRHNCGHGEDASVYCLNEGDSAPAFTTNGPYHSTPGPYHTTPHHEGDNEQTDDEVRLVNGYADNSGRVEILHNDQWGTVCDDDFDDREATVICRSLGYSGGTAVTEARFGEGSGQIWMDDVRCSGDEASLGRCAHQGWGRHNCGHGEDAGVVCVSDDGAAEEDNGCEAGWRRVDSECLRFFHDIPDNTPDQAEGICAENGASSAIVRSQAHTNAIMRAFPEEQYFCFPGEEKRGGIWAYPDGSPITWSNWRAYPPEPQNDGDCISVLFPPHSSSGEWNDVPCTSHCGNVILCSTSPRD